MTDSTSLPRSVAAERSVLGACLRRSEAMSLAAERLRTDSFGSSRHGLIFEVAVSLFAQGQSVEPVTVLEKLKSRGVLSEVGGPSYLRRLHQVGADPEHFEQHLELLVEKEVLRELSTRSENIHQAVEGAELGEGLQVLDQAEEAILEVARRLERGEQYHLLGDLAGEVLEQMEEAARNPGQLQGLSTGFPELDELTDGLQAGKLTVLAGRPSMGKTALALDMARHVAVRQNRPVAFFSLEMAAREVAARVICGEAGVSFIDARKGRLSEGDQQKLRKAAARIEDAPMVISDPASLTVLGLRSRARRIRQRMGLELVCLDYLQLLSPHDGKHNREQEIASISRGLKQLSLELEVPVLSLCQLSRAPERRSNHRPKLSDLRESGAIEQDADLVWFVFREEVYVSPDSSQYEKVAGTGELIIGKQRNGPLGTVDLVFDKKAIRFTSLSDRSEPGKEGETADS